MLEAEKDDLLERFSIAVWSMPPRLALLLLRVAVFKCAPEVAAGGLGIPADEARAQHLLARAMLGNLVFERGEARS